MKPMVPRAKPRLTFSALVDALAAPAHRLPAVLRPHKYPKPGPMFGNKQVRDQLVAWAVDGAALNPAAAGLREYETVALQNIASTITGVEELLPGPPTQVMRPSTKSSDWTLSGVTISFHPDVIVEQKKAKQVKRGAVKFYVRQEPLNNGPMLASLLFWHRSQVLKEANVDPALCAVTDVQAGIVYTSTGSYKQLKGQVEQACTVIAAIWAGL